MYYIGIDLGGTYTRIALINKNGKILAKLIYRTMAYRRKGLIEKISLSIKQIISQNALSKKEIAGIGIGVPGLIDAKKGIVHYLVNIPGWKNVYLKRDFEKRLKIKTRIDNDVNVMTLGEFYFGAGKGTRNIICVTLGTGVGGGIVLGGELYKGTNLAAGEIGHIPIDRFGPKCNCGGTGCIEAFVGNRYLLSKLKKDLKNKRTLIKDYLRQENKKLTLELVHQAAKRKDRFAVNFWKETGTDIGIMLTGVVNFLNPERIVIGGGIANAGKFLFGPMRKTVKKRAMKIQGKTVKIVKAKLGEDAGLIGAAVLAGLKR